VTEVFVDVAAVAEPESVRALRYLADAGIRVVLVTAGSGELPGELPNELPDELRGAVSEVVAGIPVRPRGPAWYLTSDIARCQGSSARLRTVLIGGTPRSGSVRRCDAVARDVQAAAMEILAAVAMPGRTEDRVAP
jgi:hypothetical protein